MAVINFNAQQVQPQQAFEPIPADWYNVMIDESEIKPTNGGDGHYLEMRMNVMDGQFANRKLFGRFNIDNPNETAVEIAYAQLSAICHAVGVLQVDDTQLLHGKPFQVKVSVRPPKNGYEASNELKGFKACEGGAPAGGGQATQQGGGGAPAWANNGGGQQQTQQAQKQAEPQQKVAGGGAPWQQQGDKQQAQPEVKQEQTAGIVEDQPAQQAETAASSAKPPWVK